MWSVADPDLQIRGRGGHPDQRGRGERGRSKKKNLFRPFGPQFGLKIRGAGGPPGTSPGSAIGHCRREDKAFFPFRSFSPRHLFIFVLRMQCRSVDFTTCGFVFLAKSVNLRRVLHIIALFTFTSVG